MIPGFIEIDHHRFYGEVWPRIQHRVEALESNWKTVRKAIKAKRPHAPLIIYWGFKHPETKEESILAIVESKQQQIDQYWISPTLIEEPLQASHDIKPRR